MCAIGGQKPSGFKTVGEWSEKLEAVHGVSLSGFGLSGDDRRQCSHELNNVVYGMHR